VSNDVSEWLGLSRDRLITLHSHRADNSLMAATYVTSSSNDVISVGIGRPVRFLPASTSRVRREVYCPARRGGWVKRRERARFLRCCVSISCSRTLCCATFCVPTFAQACRERGGGNAKGVS